MKKQKSKLIKASTAIKNRKKIKDAVLKIDTTVSPRELWPDTNTTEGTSPELH